jgi:hypothetical protein
MSTEDEQARLARLLSEEDDDDEEIISFAPSPVRTGPGPTFRSSDLEIDELLKGYTVPESAATGEEDLGDIEAFIGSLTPGRTGTAPASSGGPGAVVKPQSAPAEEPSLPPPPAVGAGGAEGEARAGGGGNGGLLSFIGRGGEALPKSFLQGSSALLQSSTALLQQGSSRLRESLAKVSGSAPSEPDGTTAPTSTNPNPASSNPSFLSRAASLTFGDGPGQAQGGEGAVVFPTEDFCEVPADESHLLSRLAGLAQAQLVRSVEARIRPDVERDSVLGLFETVILSHGLVVREREDNHIVAERPGALGRWHTVTLRLGIRGGSRILTVQFLADPGLKALPDKISATVVAGAGGQPLGSPTAAPAGSHLMESLASTLVEGKLVLSTMPAEQVRWFGPYVAEGGGPDGGCLCSAEGPGVSGSVLRPGSSGVLCVGYDQPAAGHRPAA